MKRKNRYIALVFALILVSFLLSTAVSLMSLHIMSRHNLRDIDTVLAARIHEAVSSQLSEPIAVAKTMGHNSFLINALEQEAKTDDNSIEQLMKGFLHGIQSGLSYTTAFIISDATGRYYTSEGITKIINTNESKSDAWYPLFIASSEDYDLDVDRDENSDEWVIYINDKVRNSEGRLLGVCGVGIKMTKLQDLFYDLEKEYSVKINLVNADGLVQVDTDEINIENAYLQDVPLSMKNRNEYVYQKGSGNDFTVTKYVDNLGWYLVVQDNGAEETTPYLNVILINLLLCGLVLIVMILSMRHLRKRTMELSNASFRDQLTQLYNRRAYEEDKFEFIEDGLPADFVHIAVDVNGLKTSNDTLGHDAGDELIRGAADCLRQCFSSHGRVYRTGGDEFTAMVTLSEKHLQEKLAELDRLTSSWSGRLNRYLSMSVGTAAARDFPEEGIGGLVRISDERMYAAKAEHYRRTGEKRRGQ